MKKIIIISLILLCVSCVIQKGQRINGQCRPKSPNFKLANTAFTKSNKLTYFKAYIVDNKTNAIGYGFYPDGRLIFLHSKDGFSLKSENVNYKTWSTAPAIGYWRIEGNYIKTEYFSCSNSGDYIRKQGVIKGDTILFERSCGSKPFKREKCYDKYILSAMTFNN